MSWYLWGVSAFGVLALVVFVSIWAVLWIASVFGMEGRGRVHHCTCSDRDPGSSPFNVRGACPAKMRTGALPEEALCRPWPRAAVPTSTWTMTH